MSLKPDALNPLALVARLDGDDHNLPDNILAMTDGRGVDCVIDDLGLRRCGTASSLPGRTSAELLCSAQPGTNPAR